MRQWWHLVMTIRSEYGGQEIGWRHYSQLILHIYRIIKNAIEIKGLKNRISSTCNQPDKELARDCMRECCHRDAWILDLYWCSSSFRCWRCCTVFWPSFPSKKIKNKTIIITAIQTVNVGTNYLITLLTLGHLEHS